MITVAYANPGIPPNIELMAAEVMACFATSAEQRRAHRLAKVNTFPEQHRDAVKQAVNRVIKARNRGRYKKPTGENHE